MNLAREEGHLAFRSAGSHSPVDVCVVDELANTIWLIQCKTGKKSTKKLKEEFERVLYNFKVKFEVIEE